MDLKVYTVPINGIDHTMQLDEREARRLGVFGQPAAKSKGRKPSNKGKVPANKTKAADGSKPDGDESKLDGEESKPDGEESKTDPPADDPEW